MGSVGDCYINSMVESFWARMQVELLDRRRASDQASFVTGTVLPVDGGLSISSPAAWLRPDLRNGGCR